MQEKISNEIRYRFGFILSTLLGNNNRYNILRKYSRLIEDVECTWAPVRHYYLETEKDPVRILPGPLHTRAVVIAQAMPVLQKLSRLDAVMVHQFELTSLLALKNSKKFPIIINAHDNPPVINPDDYPLYPEQKNKKEWRRKLRLANDVWAARRSGYYIGFSKWSANIMRQCGIPDNHSVAQHVGLDLDEWKQIHHSSIKTDSRLRLLFVGSDFTRKGGHRLLELFANDSVKNCTLDIVTRSNIGSIPPNCRVFTNLNSGDIDLSNLFRDADVLVLPSEADLVPWVILEAMASNCAIIASNIGGIPDIVSSNCGILIDYRNNLSLREAISTLANDITRAGDMGKFGRSIIERDFNASINVPKTFNIMKEWVDERRLSL